MHKPRRAYLCVPKLRAKRRTILSCSSGYASQLFQMMKASRDCNSFPAVMIEEGLLMRTLPFFLSYSMFKSKQDGLDLVFQKQNRRRLQGVLPPSSCTQSGLCKLGQTWTNVLTSAKEFYTMGKKCGGRKKVKH
jgi:hypothetical protein